MSFTLRQQHQDWLVILYDFQRGRCAYCGAVMLAPNSNGANGRGRYATLDHIEPIWRGGRDVFENCCASCGTCNVAKGALDVVTFLRLRWHPEALADAVRRAEAQAGRNAERFAQRRPL